MSRRIILSFTGIYSVHNGNSEDSETNFDEGIQPFVSCYLTLSSTPSQGVTIKGTVNVILLDTTLRWQCRIHNGFETYLSLIFFYLHIHLKVLQSL